MVNPAPAAPIAAQRPRAVDPRLARPAPAAAPVAGIVEPDPADALAGDDHGLGDDEPQAPAPGSDDGEALDDLAAETKATRKGGNKDKELDAMRRVLTILEPLDEEECARVLVYLKARRIGAAYTLATTEI